MRHFIDLSIHLKMPQTFCRRFRSSTDEEDANAQVLCSKVDRSLSDQTALHRPELEMVKTFPGRPFTSLWCAMTD
jgi:hypothetical protein